MQIKYWIIVHHNLHFSHARSFYNITQKCLLLFNRLWHSVMSFIQPALRKCICLQAFTIIKLHWRDGSVTKHMHCPCREPEFSSHYPCLSAHKLLITLASSDLRPLTSWYLHKPPYTYTELKIIKIFVRHDSVCV